MAPLLFVSCGLITYLLLDSKQQVLRMECGAIHPRLMNSLTQNYGL